MARFLHHDFDSCGRNRNQWVLAFFWIAGMSGGILASQLSGPFFLSLMRGLLDSSVSIVGLLSALFLPFLLSAFAVSLSAGYLIFPIAFFKSFSFCFVSVGMVLVFGSSGWLIRLLFCFADLASLPALYWFWLRCLNSGHRLFGRDFCAVTVILLLIAGIDYRMVLPFAADLINL